jgi:hypothetical protein
MTELAELATEISGFISARAKRFFYASNFVKIVLVIGGSVVAGVAHFCDGEKLTAINIVGICASIVVGIGGVFLFISDRDTSLDLDAARRAIEKASEKQLVLDQEESWPSNKRGSTSRRSIVPLNCTPRWIRCVRWCIASSERQVWMRQQR